MFFLALTKIDVSGAVLFDKVVMLIPVVFVHVEREAGFPFPRP